MLSRPSHRSPSLVPLRSFAFAFAFAVLVPNAQVGAPCKRASAYPIDESADDVIEEASDLRLGGSDEDYR